MSIVMNGLNPKITYSPWGEVQTQSDPHPGISVVSTAGHGGIYVTPEVNAKIPEVFRMDDGWYEEDVDWAIVHAAFPELFPDTQDEAHRTLKDYRWRQYERHYGVELSEDESPGKREHMHIQRNANRYLVRSAFGNHRADVPEGKVGVVARLGKDYGTLNAPEKSFLVSAADYDALGPIFVVPEDAESWSGP